MVITAEAKSTAVIAILGMAVLVLLTGCTAINSLPVASFTRNPSSGPTPLNVSFNAAASRDSDGTIVSYEWSFGDGGSATGVTTSHTYQNAGTYTAVLRVIDNDGNTDTASRYITVTAAPSIQYHVTVDQILAEFEANEVAAEMKYENKLLAVSGYVQRISTYWNDEPIVVLGSQPGGSSFDPEVLCYFPIDRRASVAQLTKGDFITVVGEYWMYGLGNVYVHYCYIE